MKLLLALASALFLFVGLALPSSPGAPNATAEDEVQPIEPLAPLADLVGPTWIADFPGDGGMTDTQHFEWMIGGQFLRNLHWVKNAAGEVLYEGETIYAWDRESKSIRWWYFNSTGGYLVGESVIDGDIVSSLGQNHGGEGQTQKVKSELVLGGSEWSSTSFFWTGDDWKERFTMHFLPDE